MANKIKIATIFEIDGEQYKINIQPTSKKDQDKLKKSLKADKTAMKEYLEKEKRSNQIVKDIELNQEFMNIAETSEEKKELLIQKKNLMQEQRDLEKYMDENSDTQISKADTLNEKFYEGLFDSMVSGEDAQKLKEYVAQFSFAVGVSKVVEAYTKEIEGK